MYVDSTIPLGPHPLRPRPTVEGGSDRASAPALNEASFRPLLKCWLPAAWSKELGEGPQPIEVMGKRYVVFRNEGEPTVLGDRGARRGVARRYPTLERDGIVWFAPAEDEPLPPDPPRMIYPAAQHRASTIEVAVDHMFIIENWVDNARANALHGGLLRAELQDDPTATIQGSSDDVRIRTVGDNNMDSFLFSLLGKEGEPVEHIVEYRAPNHLMSIHRQGHFAAGVQAFLVPVDDTRTRWMSRVFLSFGSMTSIVFPIYYRVAHKVMMQLGATARDTPFGTP